MADLILSPIAQIVLDRLASETVRQISLLWGVNDELDELKETISTIEAVLLDAENKQSHNNQVRNWLRRLSGVVDDADNLMDEINTQALQRQVMSPNQGSTFSYGFNQLVFRYKMGRRIMGINKELARIGDARKFHLDKGLEEIQTVRRARRDTHSYISQEEVIGREEDRSCIIHKLLPDCCEENVSVVAISGMGGLGKTTLAKSVFNDEQVKKHFELKIWVCVGDNFDLESILKSLLKSIKDDINLRDMKMEQLQKKLREELDGKRYFLVLDDVWEEDRRKWLELKELIINAAKGSRVLVTTRSKKIAEFIASKDQSHVLGILNEDQSWALFKRVAFANGQEPQSSNIENIRKQMFERCKGIPLAIKTIGNLLYGANLESKWSSLNVEFSKIPQANEDDIMPTLRLSYDHLASNLKRCFAYCSVFPKDYEIEVETLVRLWMAQGFLKLSNTSEDQYLEELGYECFMTLLEGSFFQDVKVDEWGVITHCKMHDLMHDLAILVSRETRVAFSSINPNINGNTHHVSFGNFSASQVLLARARKVRTVLYLRDFRSIVDLNAVVSNCKFIRSLALLGWGTNSLNSIGKLKHLRYLDISMDKNLQALPNSITSLVNLQTLKLNRCKNLQKLPSDIEKLIKLQHLEISGCDNLMYMPRGIGQLTNLQTLSKFVLRKNKETVLRYEGELKELLRLDNLRGKLEILNVSHNEKDVVAEYGSAVLKGKKRLRSLKLKWNSDVEIGEGGAINGFEMSMDALEPHPNLQQLSIQKYGGVNLPTWLSSFTNLVNLTLKKCTKCECLISLNQLHRLKSLSLVGLAALEYISNNSVNEDLIGSTKTLLPSLETLTLVNLPNLKGWWREIVTEEDKHMSLPYFPSLSTLVVSECPKLTSMPLYPNLEHLELPYSSWKPLEETLRMKMMNGSAGSLFPTSSFSPLSKLKKLGLIPLEDLECLPDCFKSLTSLNELLIGGPELNDLCPGILHLSSLQKLEIRDFEGLINMVKGDDGFMWKALNGSLISLTLSSMFDRLTVLPKGIQHLTSLQQLCIEYCDLTTIPEWIHNLKSLKLLQFQQCPKLTSFPEGIRRLTTLNSLSVHSCPMLLQRCKRETGEDWDKISHIQHLTLYPDPNQEYYWDATLSTSLGN